MCSVAEKDGKGSKAAPIRSVAVKAAAPAKAAAPKSESVPVEGPDKGWLPELSCLTAGCQDGTIWETKTNIKPWICCGVRKTVKKDGKTVWDTQREGVGCCYDKPHPGSRTPPPTCLGLVPNHEFDGFLKRRRTMTWLREGSEAESISAVLTQRCYLEGRSFAEDRDTSACSSLV
eukprot:gene25385-11046_t